LVSLAPQARTTAIAASSRDVLPTSTEHVPMTLTVGARWLGAVSNRLLQMSERPPGWDTYNSSPLQVDAWRNLADVLTALDAFIQGPPMVSMTDGGGIHCQWSTGAVSLVLAAEAERTPSVLYSDDLSATEWEGSVEECRMLNKWLWHASAGSSPAPNA
jgi:hypothetical protein